jgi:hypothetical protein
MSFLNFCAYATLRLKDPKGEGRRLNSMRLLGYERR